MVELISGVSFQRGLPEDGDVEAAVARGEIPLVRMIRGKHESHSCEEKVQPYLLRHAIPTSFTYQSMFVGSGAGTAATETMVKNYGIPLVVRPSVVSELIVACLGDLQNAVCSIFDMEAAGSPLDDRIIDLSAVEDREAALRGLVTRASVQNRTSRATPVYVEARIYRPWVRGDFVRPCVAGDFASASRARQAGKKPMFRRAGD